MPDDPTPELVEYNQPADQDRSLSADDINRWLTTGRGGLENCCSHSRALRAAVRWQIPCGHAGMAPSSMNLTSSASYSPTFRSAASASPAGRTLRQALTNFVATVVERNQPRYGCCERREDRLKGHGPLCTGTQPDPPEVQAELHEEQQLIQQILKEVNTLPDQYRCVVEMRLKELSYDVIAIALEITAETARSRYHRAVCLLRHHFRQAPGRNPNQSTREEQIRAAAPSDADCEQSR